MQRVARERRPFTFALAATLARAEPLAAYLGRALGRSVRLVVADNYAACLESLQAGRIDAAMLGEAAALQAATNAGIEGLVLPVGADGHVATYRSFIFTRIDSPIRDLAGTRGKQFGLVDERSASGYRMPRTMLREAGLDPDRDVRSRLLGVRPPNSDQTDRPRHAAQRRVEASDCISAACLGSHRLVVQAVLDGSVDVGATHANALRPPSLDRAPDYARLRVLAMSRAIPRAPLLVRANLSARTRRALLDALLSVDSNDRVAAQVFHVASGQRFTIAAPSAPPTLKSIAQLAGVSYATVSRAINGAGSVSPETARRVQAIVDEIGYRPNGHALTLQGRVAPLVGLVQRTGLPAQPDRDLLIDVARRQLALAGVPLVLCPVDGRLSASPYLELLMDGRFGALVVDAEHADEPEVVRVARTGRVVIGVDTSVAEPALIRTPLSALVATVVRCVGSLSRWT